MISGLFCFVLFGADFTGIKLTHALFEKNLRTSTNSLLPHCSFSWIKWETVPFGAFPWLTGPNSSTGTHGVTPS